MTAGFIKPVFNWHRRYQTDCCHWKRFISGPEFPQILIILQATLSGWHSQIRSHSVHMKPVLQTPSSGKTANMMVGIKISPTRQNQREIIAEIWTGLITVGDLQLLRDGKL